MKKLIEKIKQFQKLAQQLEGYEIADLPDLPEDFEPEGLWDEIIMTYGDNPSVKVLLNILREHEIKAHSIGNAIYVFDGVDKKIIPANLKSVMTYLGY